MKIRCNRWAGVAILAMWTSQAAATDEGGLGMGGYQEPGTNQSTLRGQENIRPKPGEAKPWETRPWEAAQEERHLSVFFQNVLHQLLAMIEGLMLVALCVVQ